MTARLATLSLALLAACSSGGSGGGAAAPPAVNVSGNWSGTWMTNGPSGLFGPIQFSAAMSQSGNLQGQGTLTGSPCVLQPYGISGKVSGHTVTATLGVGTSVTITVVLTIDPSGTSAGGTYSVGGGGASCNGDTGTITVSKSSPLTAGESGLEPYPAWLLVTERGAWLVPELP